MRGFCSCLTYSINCTCCFPPSSLSLHPFLPLPSSLPLSLSLHSFLPLPSSVPLSLSCSALGNNYDEKLSQRLSAVRKEIEEKGHYDLTYEELAFGARTAWRNAPRCVNRIVWRQLEVSECGCVCVWGGEGRGGECMCAYVCICLCVCVCVTI